MLHRNNDNSNLTLPTVRLILGIFAIVLSLIFSVQFVAQGNTGAGILSAIVFCLITEFCKVMFTGDLVYYWETNQSNKVLFSALIVTVLFTLSISAAVFVLSISPAKQEATIAQFEEKRAVLEKNVEAKKAELAKCNPTFLTKCVTPRTAELSQMQTELNAFLNQADNRVIIEAKSNREFWQKAADYLGTNPNSLQLNFAIARAVLLDLLGLILVSQYTAARRLQSGFIDASSVIIEQKKDDNSAALLAEIEQLKALTSALQQKQLEQQTAQQSAVDLKKN